MDKVGENARRAADLDGRLATISDLLGSARLDDMR